MTIIQNMARNNHIEIRPDVCSPEELVYINDTKTKSSFGGYGISVLREDFAQAVRDLGFVVIDKAEMPEITRRGKEIAVDGHYRTIDKEFYNYSHEEAKYVGTLLLTLSAHLEANPPVDPKVEALADLISTIGGSTLGGGTTPLPIDFATRLLATGRIDIQEAS